MTITKRNLLKSSIAALAMAAAVPAYAQDSPVIASIVFQGDQFMKSLQQGIKEGAEAGGAEVLEINIDGDQTKESQAIDTYIARGVDAIVIAPLSTSGSAGAVQRARDAGIMVIALNGGLDDKSIPNATFSTPNIDLGKATGEAAASFIAERLGGKANVGILAFDSLLPEQSGQRTGGFEETAAIGNELNVVARQDAWLPEKAVTVATDMMTANPEINVIYAANEGGTIGAMQAVRNAGKAGQVFVFGIDGSPQLAKGLLAGDNVLQAVTAQSPVEMGRMGAEAALKVIAGASVEAETIVPTLPLNRNDKAGVEAFLASLE
ncbi:simple sugar transport system substrate-binding protein [Celeribacter baekdonensis]|uniref:Simple sugar transport system substrate-binding protein n=1 Tax=Celeribacter baekdonensis TaxID=875171 RepID=A0A1G7QU80_9RHOB|nr:substrate-binding domain-containing protein [Celeribacter baekdonensis]SDG02078.1 simple sugar transport system substrate-binding protein [Celeribacter baekdonensis]